jgi:hypothetical protein
MQGPWNPPPAGQPSVKSCLTFAPLAWLKLQFFCHAGATEIGGFGISSAADLLYVEDFVTVRQQVTPVTVRFDDDAIADFFDASVDRGLRVEQFARIWMHTHPSASVEPSGVDENTFIRCFGACNWALMFILGRTGRTYARLVLRAGPGAMLELPTAVDWADWPKKLAANNGFLATQQAQWNAEYDQNIEERIELPMRLMLAEPLDASSAPDAWWDDFPYQPELDEVTYGLAPPF